MQLDDLHRLTEEQISRLLSLELKQQWEVVRDRSVIGYYQKFTGPELMRVNGKQRVGSNNIISPVAARHTTARITTMHPITKQLFNKWRNDIPIIEPDVFQGYFADILEMAGITSS